MDEARACQAMFKDLMSHSKLSKTGLRALVGAIVLTACPVVARAHDVTTHVTWNREISRIVYARCATCHRPGGRAFSLLNFQEASPWAIAIKEQVLQREMPPWGAVKGFGTFRNDQALSQEEIDLIRNWVDGGVPEGNPDHLPAWASVPVAPEVAHRTGEIIASGEFRFQRPFTLDGFWVRNLPKDRSAQITIEFPDGRIEPLVWLYEYSARQEHPFLLRTPMSVPSGALVHGLAGSSLVLLPATSAR
jgi:mono/diheme cytochrome c family protein